MSDRGNAMAPLERFGRYEVLGSIGEGAFADVVRAWDDALASHVAIKVLKAAANRDPLLRERFVEEGQLLRRIRSDHVIGVHDVGELDDGRPFLVVDLAEGGTLADRLDQHGDRVVDDGSIRHLIDVLAGGLAALHAGGIVHRDIKPENLLIRATSGPETVIRNGVLAEGERLVISDLGLAKDLEGRGSAPSIIGGSAGFQAPEQLRADGAIGPATDLYAASAVLWRLVVGSPAPEPQDLDRSLAPLANGWQEFFSRAMAFDPLDRFVTAVAWQSAALDHLDREPVLAGGRLGSPETSPTTLVCPYKGLAAFQAEDADRFFGREQLVDDLLQRLHQCRVLIVAGPSGSGKSSLVRAGLVPSLRTGALPSSEQWQIDVMAPGSRPFDELHYRLERWRSDTRSSGTSGSTAADLRRTPALARRLLDEASEPGVVRMLCIDQFEELFTQAQGDGVAEAFVEAIASMADPVDSTLRVVLAVRADFYGRCAQIGWLADRITANQLLVGPMDRDDMRRAIEEPARRAGLRLENGLVDSVLEEAGGGAGSLPLISHALVETWVRRDRSMLTLGGFRQAGGVAGAIAQSADELYDQRLSAEEQAVAKRLFLRLVTPGDGAADTRRSMPLVDVERDVDPAAMRRVVDAFVGARLLSADKTSIEIAHEALLGSWPRLHSWVDAERENLRTQQRIGRAAHEWDDSGHDRDLLYRGAPLLSVEHWAELHPGRLDQFEQRFVDSSVDERVDVERREREVAARAQRNRHRATAALAVLAAAAVVASVVAFGAFRRASDNAEVAERQFATALGTSALGQAASDPAQALRLAVESIERSDQPSVDARAAMVQARLAFAEPGVRPLGPSISTPGGFRVALRPDGRVAAVADKTGSIRMYDTRSGELIGDALDRHTEGPRSLDFTSDGATLVSGGSDGLVVKWALADPAVTGSGTILRDAGSTVWAIDIAPDDRTVIVAGGDGTLRQLDIQNGAEQSLVRWGTDLEIISVQYSPSGDRYVASNRDGRLQSWSASSDEVLWAEETPPGPNLWEIAFSPDGTRFATGGDRDLAFVHDTATGAVLPNGELGDPERTGETDAILGIAFTADGSRLIGGSNSGAIHTWPVEHAGSITTTPARHVDAVEHGALSADGLVYVSIGDDKQLRVWQLRETPPSTDVNFESGVYGVALDDAGVRLAAGDDTGRVHVVGVDGSDRASSDAVHDGVVFDVAWSADGSALASIGDDGRVFLWDPEDLSQPVLVDTHDGPGRSVAFSRDGSTLVSTDELALDGDVDGDADGQATGPGGVVRVWDVATRQRLSELAGHEQGVRAATFSDDGRLLATADGRGAIRLWDTENYELIRSWSAGLGELIWALDFDGDRHLASAESSEDLRVWDVTTGEQVGRTVSGLDTNGASGVGFSPDGTTVAVVSRTGELWLVDWMQGRQLSQPIDAHADGAQSWDLAFAGDAATFATSGTDGAVRVWDVLSLDAACSTAGRALDMSIDAAIFGDQRPIGCAPG